MFYQLPFGELNPEFPTSKLWVCFSFDVNCADWPVRKLSSLSSLTPCTCGRDKTYKNVDEVSSILFLLIGAVAEGAILRSNRGVLCGAQLSEALSLACGSNFYVPRQMRDLSSSTLKDSVALSFFGRRHSRGIVDECCHKSCSMQELLSYCGH
ncbi:ilGF domain-containing protein [Caerostris extrusa]|uniref:IlGF domain-containing protein n=1 Tax=Caerostris extrusa TaxID=172846 RepID=A0AAV4XW63_CAEEX|nr:ilGF domain-containing protein [Caerostris extrusa]